MTVLLSSIVALTIALCIAAVVILRRANRSATGRVLAGLMAGYGAWLLFYVALQRDGWPMLIAAVLVGLLPLLRGPARV